MWSSWHHRKGLGLLDGVTHRPLLPAPSAAVRRNRWIAALFAIGSACFALGSLPPLAAALRDDAVAVFFLGSVFFTSAAYLQFREAGNAGDALDGGGRTGRLVRLRAASVGWWATAVQLVGTVAFNVSTFAAALAATTVQETRLVWAPDVLGSICFLVSSGLALAEVPPPSAGARRPSVAWWVGAVNLAGSVAFGLSAVGARLLPTTGEPANLALVNGGTFVGAVLFLLGALLLPRAVAS